MASVTHTQVRSSVLSGYQIVDTVTATVSIPTQLFVFKTTDDSFSRVATVFDVGEYPDNKPDAIANGDPYYRGAVVTIVYAQLDDAVNFAQTTHDRLQSLVIEYAAATTTFVGSTTETLTS